MIAGSNKRNDPAAAFLGFANKASLSSSLILLSSRKLLRGMNTSPRTSKKSIFSLPIGMVSGIDLMVLKLAVISSPSFPFPRVAP